MEITSEFEQHILTCESINSGTSKTGHEEFDKYGFLVLRNFYDASKLREEVPKERGTYRYGRKITQFEYKPYEPQVPGCLSRYNYPPYVEIQKEIAKKLMDVIGAELYTTYFFDRFYFSGQQLVKHTDRASCEISFTLHISSTPESVQWPIFIKSAEGKEVSLLLNPGDGLLYKGCERPHWREPLKSAYSPTKLFFNKLLGKEDDTCYHQIFFHHVLANGRRSHFAFDSC